MRDLSTRMIEAVLRGEGLEGVAELAAAEAGGPVAIVLPARGLTATAPELGDLNGLADYARSRVEGASHVRTPDEVALAEPVTVDGEEVGVVVLLAEPEGEPGVSVDREEVLRAATLAVLAELAATGAREETEDRLRGSLIEELRAAPVPAQEVVSRAARLGCDLGRGAVAIAAAPPSRPAQTSALIETEYPGAIAQPLSDGRLCAILPARGGDEAPEATLAAASRVVARLRKHAAAGASSFYADPGDLHEAIAEAELVLEVMARDGKIAEELEKGIPLSGVYRLLFRALISSPDEVRAFYDDTVEPLVRYDRQYGSELLATLEEYLARDCNMNATARAIYAHRHTVAYRLERVRELTGLDPSLSEDRERLGLGVKAYRILAPALPR